MSVLRMSVVERFHAQSIASDETTLAASIPIAKQHPTQVGNAMPPVFLVEMRMVSVSQWV